MQEIKSWYNGYRFGDYFTVYNPWSILNYCNNDYKFEPYWINTSGNDLIRECLTTDKMEDVRALIEGRSIVVEIESYTVMDNLKGNNGAFWNLLFMSGYLTWDIHKKMCIPNQEIFYFFENVVMHWLCN